MSFSKIFQIFSSLVQPFYSSLSRSISTIHGGVSHRHSQHLKTKEDFSLSILSVLSKIRGSSFMISSHNCFQLWQFFSPIQSNSRVVSISFLWRPSCHNYSFSAFNSRSPNLAGGSFKYPVISSWSLRSHVSKTPQVSSFVCQFFPVNCAFATSIFNSFGGSFKISLPSLSYQFICCFQIPPVVPSIPSQVCGYISLNPSFLRE